jgi:hypothetical protein
MPDDDNGAQGGAGTSVEGGAAGTAPGGATGGNDASASTPPWGSDFTPERAWHTIQTLREAEKERNTLRSEVQKLQDKDKSDAQRLQDERDRERSRADSAESRLWRYEVAADRGIPARLANRLQGQTRDELEQDADRLKQDFGLTGDGGEGARRPVDFDAGVRNGGSKPQGMNDIIRAARGS